MLKIAYCDDMEQDRNNIMHALTQIEELWKQEFNICSFSSGESLCKDMIKNHYDIVLLDILMDDMDGIETATRIRSLGEDSLIIFISSYDERIKELFDFRTIAFLDKPIEVDKLEKSLMKAYNIIKKDNEIFFSFTINGSRQYLSIKEIIYFESRRNEILIHTNKGIESFYDTLSSVWQQLQSTGQFIRPHRSFVFNLKYVTIKSDKVIIRDTKEAFNIGAKYKEDTLERYFSYIEKR